MVIISHRGYWHEADEKNSEIAFRRSFKLGFGTETDVRDCTGQLVISHDMPRGVEMPFRSFLMLVNKEELLLAINIKADGLAESLKKEMSDHCRSSWFTFDMSIPDMRAHLKVGNPVFARMSEVEKEPVWFDRIEGIWLDSFEEDWISQETIQNIIRKDKKVCVLSPEIHGRAHEPMWNTLLPLAKEDRLILCTDIPEVAREFFMKGTE
jgi:glycerophosphoryl diester phosphodiesterase